MTRAARFSPVSNLSAPSSAPQSPIALDRKAVQGTRRLEAFLGPCSVSSQNVPLFSLLAVLFKEKGNLDFLADALCKERPGSIENAQDAMTNLP